VKKIPTLFLRDFANNPALVLPEPHPDCAWVLAGEGFATRKLDGTCCACLDGRLYKRREVPRGAGLSGDFILVGEDPETGKRVGWVPVGDGPEDRWHRVAWEALPAGERFEGRTYELVGPKVQGNPEGYEVHTLVPHDSVTGYLEAPRTFEGLRAWLTGHGNLEGLVFHHPDGRMAKIKLRDFGIKRAGRRA
jgi:hypothetical protein